MAITVTLYKQRPDTVEAVQVKMSAAAEIATWCGGLQVTEIDSIDPTKVYAGVNVPTLNGAVRVSEGDWIIKTAQGSFEKMTNSEFLAKFEKV